MDGTCMMCGITSQLKYFDLYVIGSEGLDICACCEMEVVNFIREKRLERVIKRRDDFKRRREQRLAAARE